MEKHPHPFDDFLKEALKGHRLVPGEKSRKAFLEEASAELRVRRGWKYWPYLVATILVISTLTAIFVFRSNEKQTTTGSAITAHQPESPVSPEPAPVSASQSSTASIPASNPVSQQAAANISSSSLSSSSPAISILTSPSIVAVNGNTNAPTKNQSGILTPAPDESRADSANPASVNISPEEGQLTVNTVSSVLESDSLAVPVKNNAEPDKKYVLPSLDTLANTKPAGEREGTTRGPINQAPYFAAGIYTSPEWIFNSDDKKYMNFYGIEGSYHFGQYSVSTGAGISIFRGEVENAVEYNEYLGSYEKLDSITFTFNGSVNNFIPNVYLSNQKVWDSLAKFDSTKISVRYTYLQVPVILGYDFWQKGILNIGVRFGTVMSVLLDTKQLSDEYDAGQNIVVGVNRLTPEKVNVSWQFTGGINASAALAKNIYLEVEPLAKYYYQPFYENSAGSGKPWSVGFRIAVMFKF